MRTHKAMKGAGAAMDLEGGGAGAGGDNEEEEVKQIVRNVCEMELYKDRRVTKLDIDDLLGLLAEFNKRGVHFC
jgi:hypothetical protein